MVFESSKINQMTRQGEGRYLTLTKPPKVLLVCVMDAAKFEKAEAELPILRRFIEFATSKSVSIAIALGDKRQHGPHRATDAARGQRPPSRRFENGRPVIKRRRRKLSRCHSSQDHPGR